MPPQFRSVPYVSARHPGATPPGDLSGGANCQVYAYAILAHVGLPVPPLRSSELWADRLSTELVPQPAQFDLVLFDGGARPDREEGYAAHVGLHVGTDRILHLCREIGVPAIWSYAEFAKRPHYARLLGAKRVRAASRGAPVRTFG
ncbi:MAG TPA: cell wall hydrolase [Yinghuangia sp.]|nr:cell wall hydrolase [Yinghuangia sp.]